MYNFKSTNNRKRVIGREFVCNIEGPARSPMYELVEFVFRNHAMKKLACEPVDIRLQTTEMFEWVRMYQPASMFGQVQHGYKYSDSNERETQNAVHAASKSEEQVQSSVSHRQIEVDVYLRNRFLFEWSQLERTLIEGNNFIATMGAHLAYHDLIQDKVSSPSNDSIRPYTHLAGVFRLVVCMQQPYMSLHDSFGVHPIPVCPSARVRRRKVIVTLELQIASGFPLQEQEYASLGPIKWLTSVSWREYDLLWLKK